jgi:hypothetical protein
VIAKNILVDIPFGGGGGDSICHPKVAKQGTFQCKTMKEFQVEGNCADKAHTSTQNNLDHLIRAH